MVVEDIIQDSRFESGIEELLKSTNSSIDDFEKDTTVEELIKAISNNSISLGTLEEIFEETMPMTYIAEVIEAYENYLLTNKDSNIPSKKYITKIFDKNADKLSEIYGSEVFLNDDLLKDYSKTLNSLTPEELFGGSGAVTSVLLSVAVTCVLCALIVMLVALIGIICKSWFSPFLTLGICAALSGGMLSAACAMPEFILRKAGFGFKAVTDFALPIVQEGLLNQLLTTALIVTVAGLLIVSICVAIKVIIRAVSKKKTKAQ